MIDLIYQVTQTLALITLLMMVAGKVGAFDQVPENTFLWVAGSILAVTVIMLFISGLLLVWS